MVNNFRCHGKLVVEYGMKLMSSLGTALVLILMGTNISHAESACKYKKIGSIPLQEGDALAVAGTVNKEPVTILLASEANYSQVASDMVERQHLRLRHTDLVAFGAAGEVRLYDVHIKEFGIGPVLWNDVNMFVVDRNTGPDTYKAVLGHDFLFSRDVEIWWQGKTLSFFEPESCKDAFLAYWDKTASSVDLLGVSQNERNEQFIVKINGQPVRAKISSGLPVTTIDIKAARRLGLKIPNEQDANLTAKRGPCRDSALVSLDNLEIDDELIQHGQIRVCDLTSKAQADDNTVIMAEALAEQAELRLGADFVRTHRLLFAMSQRRLYFSYIGGKIFKASDAAD